MFNPVVLHAFARNHKISHGITGITGITGARPDGGRKSGIMWLARPCTGASSRYRGPRRYPHVLQILDDLQARSSLLNTQWEFARGLVCGVGSPLCVNGRSECTTRMCYIWALDCILATLPADPRAHTYVDSPDSMAQTFVAKPMRLHMYSSRCCEAWARLHRAGHFSLSSGYTARLCTT